MRRIVLIDGENLIYGLRHLLGADGNKADRSFINNFGFRGLFEEILADMAPSEILWFGARLRIYEQSEEIKLKSEAAVRQQSLCNGRDQYHGNGSADRKLHQFGLEL